VGLYENLDDQFNETPVWWDFMKILMTSSMHIKEIKIN